MKIRTLLFLSALSFFVLGPGDGLGAQDAGSIARRVIIFVWDGLRADDVTPENMPNYFALARSGVLFADHHAVYPTFTMMNSASIATGTYPGMHGFYGNVVYAPNAKGKNAKGVAIDFLAPAFIEDFGVVEAVRDSYQGRLTLVSTMLQAAQAKGLTTAAVGKFGAAFIQDYHRGGIILDEDAAIPLSFAKELQNAGYALPKNTVNAYSAGALVLAGNNGDPTAPIPIQRLNDRETANPLDRTGALSRRGFTYLTDAFVNYILPTKKPDLTIFWSKEPDATNHAYGPGTYNSIDATKMNDEILGRVVDKIRQLGWEQTTDIIITQDHNHSTVSGDVAHFPFRAVPAGAIVVAANAGSDYLFVPDGDVNTVKAAVLSLQSRLQFGAIFVSDKYGDIPGTLRMGLVNTDSPARGRGPDIIVSFSFDENVAVAGRPGISYASSVNRRGDHGSFSRTDTHISLMAHGPDFKSGMYDTLPTANVDIAPTVARILGLNMPNAQGRVLEEALKDGPRVTEYAVLGKIYRSSEKSGLKMRLPTDLDGRSVDPNLTTYSVELTTKVLTRGSPSYTYFDQARAIRE